MAGALPLETDPEKRAAAARLASLNLASLMERQLGVSGINNAALRLFLQLHWQKVSTLAHVIHDGIEKD